MEFNYFDEYTTDDTEAPAVNEPSQIRDEMSQLYDIANKIGSYRWNYKEDFSEAPDNNEHLGIVAQQLLQVPGLEAAVSEDPNTGVLKVDTQYVALAALGLIAALTRYVLNINGTPTGEQTNGTTNTELPNTVSDTEATGSLPEEFAGTETTNEEAAPETESGTDAELGELGSVQTTGTTEPIGDTTSTGQY